MANDYMIDSMPEERVLITGGMGFIGSNLAHLLVKLGAEVTLYDAMLAGYGGNPANIKEIEDKVNFVRGDVRDYETLKEHVKDKDLIFNCAAQVSHLDSMSNPSLDLDINCVGGINLLEACRRFNDGVRIVYAGTRGQMGRLKYSPADENHPDDPTDVYGIHKLAAERYHLLYHKVYGIKSSSIRINNTYGPRHQMKHNKYGVLNWFIRLALENRTITIYGDGQQIREYNYVDDVSDAMVLTAQSDKSDGEFFLLGVDKPVKFIDMVESIIRTVGKGSYVKSWWPEDRKSIDVGDFISSYRKINRMLGWYPKTSFEEGLERTVSFYRTRLNDYV